MITEVYGNMFDYPADIRVNTVNCYGVMGKGIALCFKKRNPDMYYKYKALCMDNLVKVGEMCVIPDKGEVIVNFPTKNHWKHPSKYQWIELGLKDLVKVLENYPNKTVTIPALGCSNGGLDWNIVKPMMYKYLENLNLNIYIFKPL